MLNTFKCSVPIQHQETKLIKDNVAFLLKKHIKENVAFILTKHKDNVTFKLRKASHYTDTQRTDSATNVCMCVHAHMCMHECP